MTSQIRMFNPTPGKVSPIQIMILVQLLETSKYGYEILTNIRNDFKDVWEPKTGTVYPALKALEKKGLIETKNIEDTTYYSLTETGNQLMETLSDLVADYILFNTHFIDSTVKRLPPDFIQQVFYKIHSSGVDEILPEATVVGAIRGIPNESLAITLLESRKLILQRKLDLVEQNLVELRK